MVKKQYNTIDKAVYRKKLLDLNIEVYNKMSLLRGVSGVVCIFVGVTTFYIPFTTMPLLVIGGSLLGYDVGGFVERFKYESKLLKMRMINGKR